MEREIQGYWSQIGKRMAITALNHSITEAVASSPVGAKILGKAVPFAAELSANALQEASENHQNLEALGPYLEDGYKLVVLSNHQTLGDLAPAYRTMKQIIDMHGEYIEGFDLVTSASLLNGLQRGITTAFYHPIMEFLEREKIETVEVVTKNDIEKRGMNPDPRAGARVFMKLRDTKRATFFFPEANTNGGKLNENGEINGVGVMDEEVEKAMTRMRDKKMKVVFLLLGIDGLYDIFSSEMKNFTDDGIKILASNFTHDLLGMHGKTQVGSLRIREPFPLEEIAHAPNLAKEIMDRIREIVPEKARGRH